MNENWKFSDIPYTSPDVEALQTRYDDLTRRARAAACPEDLLDVVRQRDALQQEVALCQSIATIRAFHGKTAGSLSVGGKSTYREPYLPLVQQVTHVEYGNAGWRRWIPSPCPWPLRRAPTLRRWTGPSAPSCAAC